MKLIPEKDCPELQRHPESGVWYYRKFVAGRGEFFRSTRERVSKAKAKAIGLRMFAEWLGTREAAKEVMFLYDDLERIYLEQKKNRSRATQVSAELHTRKHLSPYFTGYPVRSMGEKWEDYVAFSRAKDPTRKLKHDAQHFKGMLKLAFERGMIDRLPRVRRPDPKSDIGREYTEQEIERLLRHAGPDLTIQIKMGYLMGMRRSEILKLSWDRLNLKDGVVVLRAKDVKTRQGREVPMHVEVWAELKVRARKAQSQYVFPSPKDLSKPIDNNKTAWRRCKRDANVIGRFHDLRHTFITRALHVYKLPSSDVSAIAGMSLAQMERYRHARGKYLKNTMDAIRGISGNDENETETLNDQDELQ